MCYIPDPEMGHDLTPLWIWTFRSEIQGMAKELFEFGLQQHEAREEELSSFKASMDSLINISTEFNIMKIDRFLEYKRKVMMMMIMIMMT